MNTLLPMTEDDIRKDLNEIMGHLAHTRNEIAKLIGINTHTLNFFLAGNRATSRITLAKIRNFIHKQRN